nr:type-F conjugative transfer system pilin assembly protein TrbC [Vibrio coralliilyticus]
MAAPLLIRGPLPAGFTATAQRLMGLLNAKGALPIRAGVAIDPDAFHRFHVRDVPTFVLIKSNRCQARWPCGPDDHAKIKGNVSIRTALEALSTSPLADVAETLLEAQRDDH